MNEFFGDLLGNGLSDRRVLAATWAPRTNLVASMLSKPDELAFRPRYAVWELTLACTLACRHCGSRAGQARPREFSTEEALRVVRELAALGVREVTLIGGEAYLREDWEEIVVALNRRRIQTSVVTGGRGLTAERARRALKAGVASVSVSVDGLADGHDYLRGWKGSFDAAMGALDNLRAVGVPITANTQVNRVNFTELEPLCAVLLDRGVLAWQVQLTSALGRAADHPEILFQPYEILDVIPKIAALSQACATRDVDLAPGNNVGYFGPYEGTLRARSGTRSAHSHWRGCTAGRETIGIESDGTLKGCPSLQTADYNAGNLLQQSAGEIWHRSAALKRHRAFSLENLWGFCRTCCYADTCRAGCHFTAHALLGRPGNMPYCYHRAETLAARGLRERLTLREAAPGRPFDNGLFDLAQEQIPRETT